jgi:PhnB protein
MAKINVYLNFNGSTEEAFIFYQSVFGGIFDGPQRFKDTPGVTGLSAADAEKIMHISLPVGDNLVLHATDALEAMGHPLTVGNNFNLMIEAASKAEADLLFNLLSVGGNIHMPMKDEFWGAYYGAFTDRFGIPWMINYTYPHS